VSETSGDRGQGHLRLARDRAVNRPDFGGVLVVLAGLTRPVRRPVV